MNFVQEHASRKGYPDRMKHTKSICAGYLLMCFASMGSSGLHAQPIDLARQADPLAKAVGLALQADGTGARRALLALPQESLNETQQRLARCMLDRLSPSASPSHVPGLSGLAGQVLDAFRVYWHASMTGLQDPAVAEGELRQKLLHLLERDDDASLDTLAPALEAALKAEGWWSLQGRTGRLRELMLWRDQKERTYDVALPEGNYVTQVTLLKDFSSLGWADYATCGRRGTGGWATPERLFAVVPRYDSLDSEEFRVTFLGHETQHFADQGLGLEMEPWQLEYRAKLVELALLNQTRDRVLTKFIEDRSGDESSPHSFANSLLIDRLVARFDLSTPHDLFDVPVEELNEAAHDLLEQDTAALRRGARSAG